MTADGDMAEKSFIKGAFGLLVLIAGTGFLLSALAYGIAAIVFNWLHMDFSLLGTLSFVGAGIGLVLSILGLKLFFDNESELLKKALGIIGIALFLLGWIAVLAGFVSGGLAWIATLLLWSMGLGFISYGFGVSVLSFFGRLVSAIKKV